MQHEEMTGMHKERSSASACARMLTQAYKRKHNLATQHLTRNPLLLDLSTRNSKSLVTMGDGNSRHATLGSLSINHALCLTALALQHLTNWHSCE